MHEAGDRNLKIAVIGAGISGIGAALALSGRHDVTLIEKDTRFGGHAHTVEAPRPGHAPVAVDTGFIVFNERNYPNLCAMFDHLGVETHWSDMSFGFSLQGGRFEYACDDLDRVFAQRSNLVNPRHLGMLRHILRFNKVAPADRAAGRLAGLSLGAWLTARGFSADFRDRFILPMGGAIWSTSTTEMLAFPAENFIAFFANHDLMTGLDPSQRWRTVTGGSRAYVRRAIEALGPRARLGLGVAEARREPGQVVLRFDDGSEDRIDHAIFATHADVTLKIAGGLDSQERALLSAFPFSENRAVLHSDTSLMPKRKKAWSSWNFLSDGSAADATRPAQVTYWMNRLQGLPADLPLFVSLNPARSPRADLVHGEYNYAHPLFSTKSFAAQGAMDAIQGRGGYWHAGAWLGYGFHEDGLRSGLRVADALGARPAWARDLGAVAQAAAEAAE
jgi:predicted NAD/FAD-binding protein